MKPVSPVLLALALAGAAPFARAEAPSAARAELRDAQGKVVGTATLTEVPEGVRVVVDATALPPGLHGLHVHQKGQCQPPDFKSAGGHFDANGHRHGFSSAAGPHVGDAPNLQVGPDGRGSLETVLAGATLSAGPRSLLGPDGTAVVVHAGPDDYVTDPAGNSGDRIACGVVTR